MGETLRVVRGQFRVGKKSETPPPPLISTTALQHLVNTSDKVRLLALNL